MGDIVAGIVSIFGILILCALIRDCIIDSPDRTCAECVVRCEPYVVAECSPGPHGTISCRCDATRITK